jgi:hypothetical protein
MKQFMYLLAVLQIGASIFVAIGSKSAIHETLAITAFGFGVLSLGLGAVLGRLDKLVELENVRSHWNNGIASNASLEQHEPKHR